MPTQRATLPATRRGREERSGNAKENLRVTEVVSAEGREALAEGQDGGGYFSEGEILGGAGGALLPVEKELAVAVGEAGGRVYVECGKSLVDPGGRPFELGIGADGGLVEDEVSDDFGVWACRVGPLGAVLLV